jgi:hypothetical protein
MLRRGARTPIWQNACATRAVDAPSCPIRAWLAPGNGGVSGIGRVGASGKSMSSSEARFVAAVSEAKASTPAWKALEDLAQSVVGHKLFTVMTVDMRAGLARRAYSNHPAEYPVSGTKPIQQNRWFDIVHGERRTFVANSMEEIAEVFPDHELIASLGCNSVLNLPVVLEGDLVATINLLDGAGHYPPARVTKAEVALAIPARLCCALALHFDALAEAPA